MFVEVRLNAMDTYDVAVFYSIRGQKTIHYRTDGIYADQLSRLMLALDYDGDVVLNPRLAD